MIFFPKSLQRRPVVVFDFTIIEGYGAEETGRAFARAQELSAEVGASAELFPFC